MRICEAFDNLNLLNIIARDIITYYSNCIVTHKDATLIILNYYVEDKSVL